MCACRRSLFSNQPVAVGPKDLLRAMGYSEYGVCVCARIHAHATTATAREERRVLMSSRMDSVAGYPLKMQKWDPGDRDGCRPR